MPIVKKTNTVYEENIDIRLQRDQQYRKELSIAYFNSLNAAINLITANKSPTAGRKTKDQLLEEISEIRDYFIKEYKQFRVTTLDPATQSSINPTVLPALDILKKKHENS